MEKNLLKLKIRLFIFTLLLLAGFTVYANLIPAINASFTILNTKAIVNNLNNTPNTYEENLSFSDNLSFVNYLWADTPTAEAGFKKVFEKFEVVLLREDVGEDEKEEVLKGSLVAVAVCKDITVQLDATGNATITPPQIDDGSSGGGDLTITLDISTFNCSNIGANTVTLSVFDDSDNSTSTCNATVTVVDDTVPTAIAQNVTVTLDATGNGTTTAALVNNDSNDACGIASLSLSKTAFTCADIATNPNSVTLTVTDNNTNVSTATANVTVQPYTTNATVNYSISPNNTTICDFEELTFTATSNNMPSPLYEWFVKGISQGAPSSISTFTKTGGWDSGTNNVEVVVTSDSSSCTPPVSEVKPISVNVAKPISFNITGPSTICAGEIANFTVTNKSNVGSASTYEWFRGDGTVSTGVTTQSYSPSDLTNGEVILLKIVSSTPCATPIPPLAKESTNTITMTVNPLPTLTVISGSVCANGQSSINLNSLVTTNGTTVTFHNNITQAQSGTNAINSTVSPTTARSYFVRSRLNTGCFTTAEIPITIDPLPNVEAGPNQAICTGDDFDLSTISSGDNRTYYTSQANANNETNAIISIVSPTSNTTYYVRAEDSTTGCYNTDSVTITVNPLPTLNITSGSVCAEVQTSIDLNTLVTSNGTKTFYATLANAESGTSSINATVSPTTATDYFVRTQLGTGCYVTGTVSVTVDALPTLTTTDSSVCASGQTNIDLNKRVNTNGNNVTFHSTLANAKNGTSPINATVSPTTETTYYVRSQFTNGCYRTDEIVISIDALPTFDVTPAEICNGASIDLNSTVSNKSNSNDTITFYNSQTNAKNGTSPINANLSPTSTTTYYIRSVNSAGCFTTDSVIITVAANASINLNSGEEDIQSICTSNNISPIDYTISGGGSGAGATLSVTPTTGHNFTGNYSNGVFTISGTATTAGTFNYTVNTTGCGADSATGTISVFSGVPATPTGLGTLSTSFIICPTSTETYEVNEDINAVSYTWTFPSGFTVTSGANTRKVTVNVATNATSGNITVRATNPCGNSSTVSSPVNIGTVTADAGPDQYICFGSTTIATPIRLAGNVSGVNANKYGSTGNGEWWWSDNGAGGTFRKSGGNDVSYQNGWYDLPPSATAGQTIKLTIQTKKPTGSNNCGQGAKDDMFIYLRPVPTASVSSNGDICAGSNGLATFTGTPNTTITYKIGASGANQTIQLNAGGVTSPAILDVGALTATTDIIIQSVAYTNNTACANTYSNPNKPTATIVVKNTPVSNAGNDISICEDQTAQLAGVITGDINTGVWSGGTGTFAPNRNTLNAVYTPSASEITAGSVTLGLTSDDPSGPCGVSPTDEVIISINELPSVDAGTLNNICQSASPTAITLSSASIGGGNGNTTAAWSITTGGGQLSSIIQTADPSSLTYTSAPNYSGPVTLTLTTNAPGECLSVSDTVSFTIDEAPTVATGSYGDICQSASPSAITLSGATIGGGNGNTTAQWSVVSGGGTLAPASGFSKTPQTVTYTPAANYSGDVVLKLTSNANGICSAVEETTTISVNEAAVVDAGSAVTICEGETVTLAGSIAGSATSATWTAPSGSFSSSTDLNAVYTPSITNGTVTLTLTTDNPTGQCGIETSTVDIAVNEAANVSVSGDTLICSDSAANIVADLSSGSATTGTWSSSSNNSAGFGSTTASTTTYTPSATDIANETVTLTFTTEDVDGSGPCAVATDDILITIGNDIYINEQPSNIGVCVSDAASFTVLVEGANDPNDISYQWYKVNSPDDTIVTGATSETLTISQTTLADKGEYYVVVQGAAPCDAITSEQAILNVNKDIVITAQPTAVIDCVDGTANFTVTATGNIDQYTWFRTDNGAVSGTSNLSEANGVSTITLDFTDLETADDGVYYLLIEGFDGTCPDVESARVQLTVNAIPTVDAGENQTICSDGTATLSGVVGGSASEVLWTKPSGADGTFSPNDTTLGATYNPGSNDIANGSVELTLTTTNAANPCTNVDDKVTITINPIPTVTISGDETICSSNGTYSLTGSFGGGATSASWSTTNGQGSISGITYTPSATELTNGANINFTYTTDDPTGPCDAASESMVLSIIPEVTVTPSADQTICSNETAAISVSLTSASAGIWTSSSGNTVGFDDTAALSTSYTPSASEITAGSATLTFTTTNAATPCDNVDDSVVITINPIAAITNMNVDIDICANGDLTLTATASGGATSGTWSSDGAAGSISGNTYTPTGNDIPTGATSNIITLTYETNDPDDPSGPCVSVSESFEVTVYPLPTVDVTPDTEQVVCSNQTINLNATIGGGAVGGLWSSTGDGVFSDATSLTPIYTPGSGDLASSNSVFLTFTVATAANNPCGTVQDSIEYEIEQFIDPSTLTISGTTYKNFDDNGVYTTGTNLLSCHFVEGEINLTLPSGITNANILGWVYSTDLGASWNDVTPSNNSGNTNLNLNNLNIFPANYSVDNTTPYLFRAVVQTGTACGPAYSNNVVLSIIPEDLKPNPVSVSESEFCLGGSSQFSSTIDFGGDQLNEGGDFHQGQLNPNDPDSWLIDGVVKGWSASGSDGKKNQWSGHTGNMRTYTIEGTTYQFNSGDPKFGFTYGNDNTTGGAAQVPYPIKINNELVTTIETPKFSLLAMPDATFEFDEAFVLTGPSSCVQIEPNGATETYPAARAEIEISTDGGANYNIIPDELVNAPHRTSGAVETGPSTSGNYSTFGNGNTHVSIDLSDYFGQTNIRIRLKMVRNCESIWVVDNFALPNNNGEALVQWTDQFDNTINPIAGTDDVIVTPVTPGNQTYTVTSFINGCRSVAPKGSEDVQLEIHFSNAGYDNVVDPTECGSSIRMLAYDNSKTPLQNYIDFNKAGLWNTSNPLFTIIDKNPKDGFWDSATQEDIDKHNREILNENGVGTGKYIYSVTTLDNTNGVLPAGTYRDYGTTSATQYWTIVSGPVGFDVNQANANLGDYFSDVNDPQAEFFGPGGNYTLKWNIEGSDSINCSDDVNITLSSCSTLDFDGINDYVTFRDNFNFSTLGNAFSFEVWIKNHASPTFTTQTIFSKRNATDLSKGYDLRIENNSLKFRWNTNTLTASNNIGTNRWYHVAITYDGATYTIYVDGLNVGSIAGGTPGATAGTEEFLLGAMDIPQPLTPTNHYKGWMDEFRVWNVALNERQIRHMMNQEIEDNGAVRGSIVPIDIPGLNWATDHLAYYQMNQISGGDVSGGYLLANKGGIDGKLINITTIQDETAPLPYTTKATGNWDTTGAGTPWTYGDSVWDHPNSNGINGDPIDWNIVEINNADIVTSVGSEHNSDPGMPLTVLGLIVDPNAKLFVTDTGTQDEKNNGQGLWVTHYLKLDGVMDLVGESQLVQKRYTPSQQNESILDEASGGWLERDQQGTQSSFNYNYWSSPVSLQGEPNNSGYNVGGVLGNPKGSITYVNNPFAADATPLNPNNVIISSYWLWTYYHAEVNVYANWEEIWETETVSTGEGFTMKGTSGAARHMLDKQNYAFKGKPHNGDFDLSMKIDENYLIGNPYPSAMDADAFILDNLPVFDGALYFWDHFTITDHYLKEYIGGYATYNLTGGVPGISDDYRINANNDQGVKYPGQYIPVAQAFLINSSNSNAAGVTGGPIHFKNSQRIFKREQVVFDDSRFLKPEVNTKTNKEKTQEKSKIRISFKSPGGYHRQILVGAIPSTTNGFDLGYDALLFDDNVEDMYWMLGDNNLVIQGVPNFNKDQVLPLGVKIKENKEFRIKIDTLENVSAEINVYLNDKLKDSIHDLKAGPYVSTSEPGYIHDRFEIIFFKEEPPVIEGPVVVEPGEEGPIIEDPQTDFTTLTIKHAHNLREIQILNPEKLIITSVYLFDLNGNLIENYTNIPQNKEINLRVRNYSSGVYLLKVYAEGKIIRKKIIISN
jgi:hypothetical protein